MSRAVGGKKRGGKRKNVLAKEQADVGRGGSGSSWQKGSPCIRLRGEEVRRLKKKKEPLLSMTLRGRSQGTSGIIRSRDKDSKKKGNHPVTNCQGTEGIETHKKKKKGNSDAPFNTWGGKKRGGEEERRGGGFFHPKKNRLASLTYLPCELWEATKRKGDWGLEKKIFP